MKKRNNQVLFVSPHRGLWEVRRCGRALAVAKTCEEAISAGRRIAFSAAAFIPVELRVATGVGAFLVEGVYSQKSIIEPVGRFARTA